MIIMYVCNIPYINMYSITVHKYNTDNFVYHYDFYATLIIVSNFVHLNI